MNGSRNSRKSKSKEDEGRNREKEWERVGECDKRHNVLWDAFGHSEHLSKQGSLNGRLTNGYGRERQRGRERWGETHKPAAAHAHTNHTCIHRHNSADTFFCLQQIIDTRFVQSYSVIAIELFWRSCMSACVRACVCAFVHPIMLVSVCKRSVCMFTFQLWFLVVRYFPPSLIVMNWVLCQSVIWIVFFSPSSFFSRHFGLSCVHSPFLSLSLSPFLSVLLSLYKKHP